MNTVKRILVLGALCGVACGAYASDAGVSAADAGVGSARSYEDVVDVEGLSKLNPVLMRELVNKRDESTGLTPLHFAAYSHMGMMCGSKLVRCICYWGADVNARDNQGNTPLHKAALFGDKKIMSYLLARGADLTLKNHESKTPGEIFLAEHGESYESVEYASELCEPLFSKAMIGDVVQTGLLGSLSLFTRLSEMTVIIAALCGVDFSSVTYSDECMDDVHMLHGEIGREVLIKPTRFGFSFASYQSGPPPSCDALRMLVKCGAPLFECNREGKTAEQVAREHGFVEAADFLKSEMEKVRASQ